MTQQLRSIIRSVHKLSEDEKFNLYELLDQELAQHEEELLERDPKIQSKIREAKNEYEAGKFLTIEEYAKKRLSKS